MEEAFKPQSLTIKELFGNADAFYKIPQYQRPYKWEDEQVDKLWEDLHDAWEDEEQNYFLGSIITAKPRGVEKSAYLDVVDGQQRLTTLMILFCVVRDLYPAINQSLVESDPLVVDKDTIMTSIALHGKTQRLKLVTHAQHHSDFEQQILKGNTLTLKKPFKYEIKTDEEPQYKFRNTAAIFHRHLKALGEEKAGPFVTYLFNQVKLIRIDCQDREFAIRLFQVLNDRGMDLTAADLVKSFLIERLQKLNESDADASRLKEDNFIADWRAMEQTVNSVDITLNDLFTFYEYYMLGQNPKRSLYDEMQDLLEGKDPNEVVRDLKKFADSYASVIFHSTDKNVLCLWYVRWAMHWKSILLTALHEEHPDFDVIAKALCRFYYLYWIAGRTLTAVKQTSFNIIKWIKEKKSGVDIARDLEAKLDVDKIFPVALEALTSEYAAKEFWCKPLLIMLEYNSTDSKQPAYIDMNRDLHLEHILPDKWRKFPEWKHITEDVANKWLNSAGNLTLLSGTKNIEASNNPFDVKMNVYRGKGKYEDKDEKITEFQITQRIVTDFEKSTYRGQWTEQAMKDRWDWFFTEVGDALALDTTAVRNAHNPVEV